MNKEFLKNIWKMIKNPCKNKKKLLLYIENHAHIIARIWLASFYHLTVNYDEYGHSFNYVIIYILKYRMTV